jgi:hypothetical protein
MTTNNKNSSSHKDYTARYLVLLSHQDSTRALLFTQDQRYLSDLIDEDGLMLDNLLRRGRVCPTPNRVAKAAWASAPATVRCYALDASE